MTKEKIDFEGFIAMILGFIYIGLSILFLIINFDSYINDPWIILGLLFIIIVGFIQVLAFFKEKIANKSKSKEI